jgi:hypothetical protein
MKYDFNLSLKDGISLFIANDIVYIGTKINIHFFYDFYTEMLNLFLV